MTGIFGEWVHEAAALNGDGTELYAWSAHVTIEQEGADVRVTTRTEHSKSRSISTNALIERQPDGRNILLYDYIADPAHEATASHDFFGMTRLVFDADGTGAEGHYLNYNGRYTFGRMTMTPLGNRHEAAFYPQGE